MSLYTYRKKINSFACARIDSSNTQLIHIELKRAISVQMSYVGVTYVPGFFISYSNWSI